MSKFQGYEQTASNIRTGTGDYTVDDFLGMYPQFSTVPQAYLDMTVERANASIAEARWHTHTEYARGLYCAHFCVLYLKGTPEDPTSTAQAQQRGEARGSITSKSVGGVSVSYSSPEGVSDLSGYASWKDTVYGQQLATIARMVGHGMMVVR